MDTRLVLHKCKNIEENEEKLEKTSENEKVEKYMKWKEIIKT